MHGSLGNYVMLIRRSRFRDRSYPQLDGVVYGTRRVPATLGEETTSWYVRWVVDAYGNVP